MLTCPNCHHVLAAQSCCGLTFPQPLPHLYPAPTMPTTSPSSLGPQLGTSITSPPIMGPLQHGTGHGPTPLNINIRHQMQSMATPHVSGHMFHFPTVQMSSFPTCQGSCHTVCHSAVQPPQCLGSCRTAYGGMWRWPDSGGRTSGQQVSSRMHTSGGGIVDEDNVGAKTPVGGLRQNINGLKDWTKVDDDRILGATRQALTECGWYWERLSWQEAETILQSTTLGTFIIRDSADTRFLYSLSVQTERGPTSVRIHYLEGKFRLDCEPYMASTIPEFSCVIALVEYYIRMNKKLQRHVWVDAQGKMHSPITIKQPHKREVPTLKHLCRLSINMSLPRSCSAQRLPPALCEYIDEYPYCC